MPLPWWMYVIVPGTATLWILLEPKLWSWEEKLLNAREARRRQLLIETTLVGMNELFTTNLWQEMDPEQEKEAYRLMGFMSAWYLSGMSVEAKQNDQA